MCESQFAGLRAADRAALCAMMRSYEDVVTRLEEFVRALTIHLGAMDVDEPPETPRPPVPPPVPPRPSLTPVPMGTSETPEPPGESKPRSILKKRVTFNPEVRSALYGAGGDIRESVPVDLRN